jgi:hypothetical protein
MCLDRSGSLHIPDGYVSQFVVDVQRFSQSPIGDTGAERRLDLILRDQTLYRCHYLFDSFGREKVVRADVGVCCLDELIRIAGSATDPYGDVPDGDATR